MWARGCSTSRGAVDGGGGQYAAGIPGKRGCMTSLCPGRRLQHREVQRAAAEAGVRARFLAAVCEPSCVWVTGCIEGDVQQVAERARGR